MAFRCTASWFNIFVLHLKLLSNIGCVSYAVHYIPLTSFVPGSLHLLICDSYHASPLPSPQQFAMKQYLLSKWVLQYKAWPCTGVLLSHWLKFSSRRAWPHVKSRSGPWRHKQSEDGQSTTVLAAGQLLLNGKRSRVHISLPSTEKVPPSMCQRILCPVKSLSVYTREQLLLST